MLGPWSVDGEQLEGTSTANASSPHDNGDQRQHKMLPLDKSDEVNGDAWLIKNAVSAADGPDEDAVDEKKRAAAPLSSPTKKEVEDGLEMLENLVHPEDELQDEEDDRQIFQAVVTSMAQWNLRKIQKLKEKKSSANR